MELSELKKRPLRDIWKDEGKDFTPWLAEEENLDMLGEEIGIDINLIQTEKPLGAYKADIYAEDERSRKIVIENQLESTNHDHLGKLLVYASGLDAEIIIWIVKEFTDDHKNAVNWLNEHTDENISFFLIKIEVWQIEDSKPAPKFQIIVSPNEWAKSLKEAYRGDMTETENNRLSFWTEFREYIVKKDTKTSFSKPKPIHYYTFNIGKKNVNIDLVLRTKDRALDCGLDTYDKPLFDFLEKKKHEIEEEIGEKLEWKDSTPQKRIIKRKYVSDVYDKERQNNFNWFYENIVLFRKVFIKYIEEFRKED
ncbi:MAG: DUF4268 domain-containing protein [Candidatus Coatesbacteria bacterium]|nr:DUF4268 domain-containing protein [Candidatus Coatesbacteria bacterium]